MLPDEYRSPISSRESIRPQVHTLACVFKPRKLACLCSLALSGHMPPVWGSPFSPYSQSYILIPHFLCPTVGSRLFLSVPPGRVGCDIELGLARDYDDG